MTGPDVFQPTLDVNVILLRDGREIHLDDIETAAQGQAVLDGLDEVIDLIEIQVDGRRAEVDPFWLQRARTALKRKRRQRPRLERRIGELRRSEAVTAHANDLARQATAAAPKRRAFVRAAEELLPAEVFTEIWARAAEREPTAFDQPHGRAA